MENTRLDEERKQETKCVWISGKYFYMITSSFHIIYLHSFVAENLESLIFISALLPFFFLEVPESFPPPEKRWILGSLWVGLLFFFSCGQNYNFP